MTTKRLIETGMRVRVLNKFGDEIADGFVGDVDRNGFDMVSDGDTVHICWHHITKANATEITLSVVGDTLERQ